MSRVFVFGLALLAALAAFNEQLVAATVYTSGSTTVDVTIQYLDEFGSNEKCVKYISNAPEKYNTACFTTTYTDGGTFSGCQVQFGDYFCNSCAACQTTPDYDVGYTIDCYNIQPAETVDCVLLNDTNIQEVLVDTDYASQPFNYSDNSTSTDRSGSIGGGGNETNGGKTSGATSPPSTSYAIMTFTAAAVYLVTILDGF
jgi:hypothetical protein